MYFSVNNKIINIIEVLLLYYISTTYYYVQKNEGNPTIIIIGMGKKGTKINQYNYASNKKNESIISSLPPVAVAPQWAEEELHYPE